MDFRKILVPVSHSGQDMVHIEAAFAVGKVFDCHVEGLHVRPDPRAAIPYVGEGMTADVIQELCNAAERDGLDKCARAHDAFEAARAAAGTPIVEQARHNGGASAAWVEAVGDETQVIAARGRTADLSVVCRPGDVGKDGATGVLEGILFRSGRPALVVPAGDGFGFPKTVAIAWNGSAEAARAVAFAQPFMAKAERVVLITAGETPEDLPDAAAVADYLAWHGVAAELVKASLDRDTVGAVLLGEARSAGADILVMGAYTHSRWREMILGGVTRFMLANSDLPLLLVH